MQIPIETINKFHFIRTQAHIDCLNYHAELLGYNFPEHDNDKNSGAMMIAYSYINYASYHPEYNIPEKYCELFRTMRDEHHATQPHHINYYSNASEISDITLIEMICDWIGAGKVYSKETWTQAEPYNYYMKVRDSRIINPKTEKVIIYLLEMIRDHGIETFCYAVKHPEKSKVLDNYLKGE